ncbi:hypothetical protein, partial [Sphingobacterium multivorum]|uniref:hypothetical protein n=1 Tax=Sphingobacterium multivorum TaxID=28454 RepID=UPI003DA40F18
GVLFLINLCLFLTIGSEYNSKPSFLTYTLEGIVSDRNSSLYAFDQNENIITTDAPSIGYYRENFI